MTTACALRRCMCRHGRSGPLASPTARVADLTRAPHLLLPHPCCTLRLLRVFFSERLHASHPDHTSPVTPRHLLCVLSVSVPLSAHLTMRSGMKRHKQQIGAGSWHAAARGAASRRGRRGRAAARRAALGRRPVAAAEARAQLVARLELHLSGLLPAPVVVQALRRGMRGSGAGNSSEATCGCGDARGPDLASTSAAVGAPPPPAPSPACAISQALLRNQPAPPAPSQRACCTMRSL